MTDLAAFVRAHRLSLGLTQRGAAARCQLSLTTWQALERRDVAPSTFQDLTLARVASGLGIPLTEVFVAAGREPPHFRVGDSGMERTVNADVDPDALLAQLVEVLRDLRVVSEESFLVVCSLALEAGDRLLQVHRDEP